MLTYQDRTFCKFIECSKFHECHLAYTIYVQANVRKSGLPVSLFKNKPDCFNRGVEES